MLNTAERSSANNISIKPIFMQHLSVYEYALGLVKGKVVLDIGCGEGRGTSLLAQSAQSVVGIDYDRRAIERAKKNYISSNLNFICVDIKRLKLAPESFDAACAFQFIEHLKQPEGLLSAVKGILRPQGLFLLSTPNRKASIVRHAYHFKEYDLDELSGVLAAYFSQVEILGLQFSQKVAAFREKRRKASQRILRLDPLGLYRLLPVFMHRIIFDLVAAKLSRKIYSENRDLTENIATDDFRVSAVDIDSAIDLISVCRK